MEWSLIRELDETYFFSDSNIKYIYQAYDFPRLTESNSLQKIKTEIKVKYENFSAIIVWSKIYHFLKGFIVS